MGILLVVIEMLEGLNEVWDTPGTKPTVVYWPYNHHRPYARFARTGPNNDRAFSSQ